MTTRRVLQPSLALWLTVGTLALAGVLGCTGGGGGDSGSGGSGGGSGGEQGGDGGGSAEGGTGPQGGAGGNPGDPENGGEQGGGSGGTSSGGSGGTIQSGGATQTGGVAAGGTGGTPGTGGTAGKVDKTKERVWIDADITFGPNGSINHNQPSNWFSPIDYYNGSMQVRAVVSEAPSGFYGLELCLYKAVANDPKHDCLPLAYRLMGTGDQIKSHPKTSIILRNILAQPLVSEADFMTPWAVNHTRLIGAEHAMAIAGPVKTKLTIVLVPAGHTFSGWAGYPR